MKGSGGLGLVLAAAMVAALSTAQAAEQKMKVGFVEFATASGSAWVRANVDGAKLLAKKLPWVETTIVESIEDGPGVVAVLSNLAQQGNKVIFADSYGYGVFVADVAKQYPDTTFIVQQANPKGPNVGSYYGYVEEARYLQGIIAGKMTKTNKIGFVGAYPFAPVISGINAFALGVQSVNPGAVVKVNWVNSWYAPPKEKEAADALINDGVDIVANHADSSATLKAASAKGKWGMTSNADWSSAAPEAFLTGSTWNWGIYYATAVQQVRDGTYKPGRFMGSLENGVVNLVAYGPAVTADAKAAAEAARKKIVSGELKIFRGAVSDNQGKLRIAEGKTMSLGEAGSTMDWLVKGIEGTPK